MWSLRDDALMRVCFLAFAATTLATLTRCTTDPVGSKPAADTESSPDAVRFVDAVKARFPGVIAPSDVKKFEILSSKLMRPELPARSRVDVQLSRAASSVWVTEKASKAAVSFDLRDGSWQDATFAYGLAVYRHSGPCGAPSCDAAERADVILRPTERGLEDYLVFERAPAIPKISYSVYTSGVAGLRFVASALELLDKDGVPRLRMNPPVIVDARGARVSPVVSLSGCDADRDPRGPWGRAPRSNQGSCTLAIEWGGGSVEYPILVDPQWTTTDSLGVARSSATATVLDPGSPSSRVLFAGGFGINGNALASAEVYEPLSRTFSPTGSMNAARGAHAAASISAGVALVTGGSTAVAGSPLGSTERYDVKTGAFTADATMASVRFGHTATLLGDGRILVAGGTATLNQPTRGTEIYDPKIPGFSPGVVNMAADRTRHAATLLQSGFVLVTGGFNNTGFANSTAELFNPTTNTWGPVTAIGANTTALLAQRGFHTATLLDDGTVFIAGGAASFNGAALATTDRFVDTPQTRGFFINPPGLSSPRSHHSAAKLPNGDVILIGGTDGMADQTTTEVFTAPLTFAAGPTMNAAREDFPAVLVNAGATVTAGRAVLVAGGTAGGVAIASAEILERPLGDPCTLASECKSGFCVEGVCCDTACDAACRSCTAAGKGAGSDGACGFAIDGKDLGWSCVDEVEVLQKCDGATGTAVVLQANKCTPYKCDDKAYRCVADCPCSDAGWCADPNGKYFDPGDAGIPDSGGYTCKDKLTNGSSCENEQQCTALICVDNVCCNAACAGTCQACDTLNNVGTCTSVGSPQNPQPVHPGGVVGAQRKACDGADGGCAGMCNGDPNQCSYPDSKTSCQDAVCECADSDCTMGPGTTKQYFCDGKGACAEKDTPCAGFKCGDDKACKSSCMTDDDCILDFTCENSQCVALTGPKCDGNHTLKIPKADDKDCSPYKCSGSTCRAECNSIDDCVSPLACNEAHQCVTAPNPPTLSSCSTSPSSRGSAPFGLIGLVAALALAARRRD